MRLPLSLMNSIVDRLNWSKVSIATGWNVKELGSPPYLRVLKSACSAVEPPAASRVVIYMYETVQVCTMVASHANYLPCDQGTSVVPSGLLPSALNRPGGSLVLGTPAFVRARHKMSLIAKWGCNLP